MIDWHLFPLAWSALALAGCALLAAAFASQHLKGLRTSAENAMDLRERIAVQAGILGSLPDLAAIPAEPEPEAVPALPLTALERRIREIQRFTRPLLLALDRWSAAAEVPLAEISPHSQRLQTLEDELTRQTTEDIAAATEAELSRIAPELFQLLLTRTDHDLDPRGTNPALQQALRQMLGLGGFVLIAPVAGQPFDPRAHVSLGVFARGTPLQRGTIGQVSCRGLRFNGEVLLKAEVFEYD